MLRLAQVVKRDDEFLTVPARYEQVMMFANRDNDQARKYREELLGPNVIAGAPTRYYELAAMHSLGISPEIWSTMPLEVQGEHIAYLRLSNMQQVIERHEMLMAQRNQAVLQRQTK